MKQIVYLTSSCAIAALVSTWAAAESMPTLAMDRDTFRAEVRAYLLENPEVLVEALHVLEQRQAAADAQADVALISAHADELFNDRQSGVAGNFDGTRVLVEFFDYRCGYCHAAQSIVADFLTSNPDVKLVRKELPILGPESERAARFAISVLQTYGHDAYNLAHAKMMDLRGEFSDATFAKVAKDLKLDPGVLLAQMDAQPVTDVIEANMALARELKIDGTPGFVSKAGMVRGVAQQNQLEGIVAAIE